MSKKRTSVSLDERVAEYLQRDGVNASGLVNRLVKAEMDGGAGERQLVELRLEQVNSQISDLESRLETRREERERLQSRLEEFKAEREKKREEAVEVFGENNLQPDNPAVLSWSDELDMEPEEFIEWVREHQDK